MITSVIGKKFLKAYNEKYATNYDAKAFFLEQYYPLFFNQQKYMMTAGNSPLENPKLSWEKMIKGDIPFELPERRKERFDNFINKIESLQADASIAIGYPASDINSTTSGQVSNMNFGTTKEDLYLSWIGSGFGIGVQGGFSILLDNKNLLLDIYEGWNIYRQVLNETSNIRGNQINTWNGQWLAHRYSNMYVESMPMANFAPFLTKKEIMSVDILSWTKILIAISKHHANPQMMGYVYNIGQTNTTIGYIPFVLSQIRRPIDLYNRLFGMEESKKAESLYGTAFGLSKACQQGVIGIKAMEPKGLRDYIEKAKMPKYAEKSEESINFNVYIIWIIAMLNNEEAWVKAQEFAQELQNYAQSGVKSKTGNSRKVDTVIESTNKVNFIKAMTDIVSDAENEDKIKETTALVNAMPNDNVPYFLTLVRFHYAAINNNNSKNK